MPIELLERTFLDNSLYLWLVALLISAAVMGIFYVTELVIVQRLRSRATETDSSLDDLAVGILESTQFFLVLAVSLYAGSTALLFPNPSVKVWLRTIAIAAVLIQLAVWGHRLLYYFINRNVRRRGDEDDRTLESTVNALTLISRIVMWTIVVILILDNIPNVQISSLLAGLGIAGVAVGLAVQNILGDLLASLSIILDRPFVVGDFVTVGEYSGTVRSVGLKTTRVRSLDGEELVFSNTDMLTSRIQNYGKMRIRRIAYFLKFVYNTPADKLRQIPQIIEEVINAKEQVRFDRAHFANFGDYALEYEIVYFVLTDDYRVYRDIQQTINLELVQRFEEIGIEFAYPTQIMHLGGSTGSKQINEPEPQT